MLTLTRPVDRAGEEWHAEAVPADPSAPLHLWSWTWQPLALAIAVLLGLWYVRSVRRLGPDGWPQRRSVTFAAGVLLLVLTSCGFLQTYDRSLFSVWTTQQLVLLLVVPPVLLAGRPLELARRAGSAPLLRSVIGSRPGRVLASPLVGPALVPVAAVLLFFGPLPGVVVAAPAVGWVVQLLVLTLGGFVALPLFDDGDGASAVAVGAALAVGVVELLLDAVPGIVLRLSAAPVTTFFAARTARPWLPSALSDQRTSGAILWGVAELLDLPFLVLVFLRWRRADARETAEVDARLDAAQARPGVAGATADERPWWEEDPQLKDWLRRRG